MGYFSLQDDRCGICGEEFPKDGALDQHVEAVHRYFWWKVLTPVILLLVGGGVYYYFYFVAPTQTISPSNYTGAEAGQHWHADYSIEVCGETKQPFLYSQGDVHTHGNGQIHVHPKSPGTAGGSANLKSFIESVNGVMTDTRLVIPTWGIDSTDPCQGDPSEFVVYVNGHRVTNPTDYPPQNGDRVRFVIRAKNRDSGETS
jgi:hypothetical protein